MLKDPLNRLCQRMALTQSSNWRCSTGLMPTRSRNWSTYFVYPHLDTGAVLIIDDIHIPTIRRMFEFLAEDEMFELIEVVWDTAFFLVLLRPHSVPLEMVGRRKASIRIDFPSKAGHAKPGVCQEQSSIASGP